MIVSKAGQRSLAFSMPIFGGPEMLTQKQFYRSRPWLRARQGWLDDINCNDPEISLNEDNFQYVCLTCHNKEKDPQRATPGRCRYGPNGEILRATDY